MGFKVFELGGAWAEEQAVVVEADFSKSNAGAGGLGG